MVTRLIFVFLLIATPAISATYYVDNVGGSDSANGTAVVTPWKHIPWDAAATGTASSTALAGDDVVCVAPDVTYTVNNINPHDSGTSNHYITIDGSPTCWGSGTANATFTGSPASYTGVWNFTGSNHQWIKIKDIIISGISSGIGLNVMTETGDTHSNLYFQNIVIDNCDGNYGAYIKHPAGTQTNLTYDNVTVSNSAHTGFQAASCGTGLLITNSLFHDNGGTGNEDGLAVQANDGNCTNWTVSHSIAYNNGVGGDGSGFDTSNNNGYSNSGGVFDGVLAYDNGNTQISVSSSNPTDSVTVRNSIVYGASNWGQMVAYENIQANFYNNTCGGGDASYPCYAYMSTGGTPGGSFVNNIAYGTMKYAITLGTGVSLTSADYNILGDGVTNLALVGGTGRNWAYWTGTLGHDANGYNADPVFAASPALPNSAYYMLQTSSPAKDTGTTIASVTTDYASVPRPQGIAYDIGAYEFPGSPLVNGVCGTSDGAMLAEAPATNLCATGVESVVTGSKTAGFAWTCGGTGGGTSDACLTAAYYRLPGMRASGVRIQ